MAGEIYMRRKKPLVKYLSGLKCVRWLVSVLEYMVNNLNLTHKARMHKKAIKENAEEVKPFIKALYQRSNISYSKTDVNTTAEFIESYIRNAVTVIKTADITLQDNEPILVCVIKDDLQRLKACLQHHREIGVRHFAFIDNESTDGTLEWLYTQRDVSLFTVSEPYSPSRQRSWRRQVTDVFGYNRWYINIDSDEFFIYPGVESIPITQYIDFIESKGIEAVFAPMIDMYTDSRIFNTMPGQDFRKEYCWFDKDGYTNYCLYYMQHVVGGPRRRVFHSYVLSKYPLVKMKEHYLIMDHCNFPYKLNFQTKGAAAFLLHYKYLNDDYDRYLNFIKSGIHASKNRDYISNKIVYDAVRDNPDISLYYEGSQKFASSMDLLKINICDNAFFDDLLR